MVDSTVMQSGRYKAYPEYKDSGVEWLGDIPSGWGVVRVKNQFKVYNGATPRSGVEEYWGGDIVWVTPSDLSQLSSNTISESSRTITRQGLSSCGTTLVPKDSLILSCRAPIGSLAITKTELCTNQGCKALVPISDIPVELYYYYFSSINAELNVLGSGSTFLELSTDELVNIALPLPTYSESKLICNFLDYETAKIDTLIEKQQRLIELLTEKRQAVISHAVTKGLNPDVPMKDSGVEWLGEVPAHWEVSKFSYVKKVLTDYTANGSFADLKSNVNYLDEPSYARLVRLTDLRVNLENTNGVWINKKSYDYLSKSALYGGEFLLANVGAHAGLFYQMPYGKGRASLAPNMFMAKFDDKKVSREFMAFIGQSQGINEQLKLSATASSAQPKLNKDDFKAVKFAFPSLSEQAELVEYLNRKLPSFDRLINKAQQAVQLMQERRTALISAAVTGKIDVRDWVNPE